jgi:hypothetical protein
MPKILASRDSKIQTAAELLDMVESVAEQKLSWILPLLSADTLKRPVLHRIVPNNPHQPILPLFLNRQGDYLGCWLQVKNGAIFILPESVVSDTFHNRVS